MGLRATLTETSARIAERVAAVQSRFWWAFVLAGFLATIACVSVARRLGVRGGLEAILGERTPAVRHLAAQRRLLPSGPAVEIAVRGEGPVVVERFAAELESALRALPTDLVREVDSGVAEERAFAAAHPLLYADLADVRRLRDVVAERLERARLRENPFAVRPEGPLPPLPDLRASAASRLRGLDAFPGGRYVSDDGRVRAIVVHGRAGADAREVLERLEETIAGLGPERRAPPLEVGVTGEAAADRAEERAVGRDLERGALLAGGVVLLVLYFFFFRVRALVLLAISLGAATAWTLAIARAAVGELSAATAILAPVVLFHGLTDSVSVLARWVEERRDGLPPERALAVVQRGVASATGTATAAAAAAYGALAFSSVGGYREFGLLGLVGMAASWIAAHGLLPPLLLGLERLWPLVRPGSRPPRSPWGVPFAWLVARAPRLLAWAGILAFVAATGACTRWLLGSPIEDDVGRLGPRSWGPAAAAISARVDTAVHGRGAPIVEVAARSPADAAALAAKLSRATVTGSDAPLFGVVEHVGAVLPSAQDEKVSLHEEVGRLARALAETGVREEAEGVAGALAPPGLRPLGLRDLPPALSRRFEDREGRAGVAVRVGAGAHRARRASAAHLSAVAAAVSDVRLPSGHAVHASGRSVLVAALYDALRHDAPRLVLLSLGAVVLVTLFAFGRGRLALVATGTMLGGVATMLAIAALRGERLQPLSVLALPVTFGVGIDYAAHLVRRYAEEGSRTSGPLLRETGAVLVTTSGTTLAAYVGLAAADHQALAAFGRLAIYGELACLGAALLVLPALLHAVPRVTLLPPRGGSR